ncbi:MAG: M20/M25/M40 family metallo-hydrolase [Planctomycetota bacterium]
MPLTPLEERLCSTIADRADALLDDLAAHVAIPTGGGHRPGLDRYRGLVADRLAAIGARIREEPAVPRPGWLWTPGAAPAAGPAAPTGPVLVAERRAGRGNPTVLLVGHLDTVHDPEGPFRVLSVDASTGLATGPGAVDMKGGVLVAVAALEALAAEDAGPDWTYALNSDEETGSFESLEVLRGLAVGHDLGIVTEPALADGALAGERMGSGQFCLEVFGRAAHVGREFTRGVSAVTRLAELLVEVAALADPDGGLIASVGPIRGGGVTNAVPDHAVAWGNMRVRDEATGAAFVRRLEALATPDDAVPRVVVHHAWNRPPKPLTDAVRSFAEATRAVAGDLGQALPFASTGGVCDGNVLQSAGLPTLDTLGVRGGNLHREDEFVEVASLVERCQLMAVLLARIGEGRLDPGG